MGWKDTGIIRASNDGMDLFCGISVRNNISESINSFLRLKVVEKIISNSESIYNHYNSLLHLIPIFS
ncbi:MAG: hypothetical protein ACTSU2_14545 [Promethearchaeota archaeon]